MRSRKSLAKVARAGLAALLVMAAGSSSFADELRDRPLRILVPAVAGGSADAVSRLIGLKLQERLRTAVVVENKAGGLFVPVLHDVVNSPADGHTILMLTTSVLMAQVLHPELGFDLINNFAPVSEVATGPLILVGRKDLPAKSLPGLVAYLKSNPDVKLSIGSGGGNGSAFYMSAVLLMNTTGIELLHVPYKSSGPALNDLLGGHIDLMFDAMPGQAGQVRGGNVLGLVVTGPHRINAVPDVPTAAEAGIPALDVAGWFGFLAPAKTPKDIIDKLQKEIAQIVADPDLVAKLGQQGVEPVGSTPEIWGAYLRSELDKWTKFVADNGIKAE